ncbi:hypothetical protein B0T21DRAFT_355803 [Apiosordaria backusii]|uniref:Uncharacterized protein n=1 Tax=Apiosordaria backusii TaxID=314023 RepID=A0AA40K6S4_9PEZI|nr:hypothetical protein B0T21DRAFT_355803 [Apiosordaria backusii]
MLLSTYPYLSVPCFGFCIRIFLSKLSPKIHLKVNQETPITPEWHFHPPKIRIVSGL